ncbi:MAG TPA: ribonuclease HII [Candidatus Cloacimonetes bacterium]|nr:ribonuclease HII [Candidatus Cloacimonadota bacterium]
MLFKNEFEYRKKYKIIAGIDEAGRGPLAGPVVVAAVILDRDWHIEGLNDSKKLSEKKRNRLAWEILEKSLDCKVIIIPPTKIDEINILQATLLGMEQAVLDLKIKPDICLIDGNKVPEKIAHYSKAIVKGDAKYASIAAASILAKVTRDRIMREKHEKFPVYNFRKNKGYPTREHIAAIRSYGITSLHRKTFRPVKEIILENLDRTTAS